jgi:membrane-associated protease RseP (regulator of RpoE activity)
MPTQASSSTDSQRPSETVSGAEPTSGRVRWKVPLVLFLLTVASILYVGAAAKHDADPFSFFFVLARSPRLLAGGLSFAVPLLAILVTHEFGHYIAARVRGVSASLPLFLPLPISLFGTLGAVIVMRDRIKSRNALLEIGASGPLAGMAVAIPVLLYGLAHSRLVPISPGGSLEGQSLLYLLLKRVALGPIPSGWDVYLSPVALAGWVGLLVTMINLIPAGQLDGGHVAYAVLGDRYPRLSRQVRAATLLLAFANLVGYWLAGGCTRDGLRLGVSTGTPWVVWFLLLTLMRRLGREEHPVTDPGPLSPVRRIVGAATLVLFALLFMPTIWIDY